MKHGRTEEIVYLTGGALLGAAALYFLDPSSGQRRRQRLAAAAEGAYDQARHVVGETWDDVSSRAKELSHHMSGETAGFQKQAADSAHALADEAREIAHNLANRAHVHSSHLHDLGSGLWNRARELAGKLSHHADKMHGDVSGRAHDWGNWFSRRATQASGKARSWLGHEEHHEGFGGTTVLSSAVGCCAIGAGAMYLLDPDRGHARRQRLLDMGGTLVCNTGHTMRATGQAFADTWHRFFHKGGDSKTGKQRIDSENLVRRIRSEIGWYSPNVNRIQLMADADGTVTVTGNIPAYEVDTLLALLHRINGVTHVINRLNQQEAAESESQRATPSAARR